MLMLYEQSPARQSEFGHPTTIDASMMVYGTCKSMAIHGELSLRPLTHRDVVRNVLPSTASAGTYGKLSLRYDDATAGLLSATFGINDAL
jgi:hypothetical protein